MERNLQGKVIVITGASSGFGKGAALRFADMGASVVIAARRGEVLEDLAKVCAEIGGSALPVTADVSNRNDVERIFNSALGTFGQIDVWINNAGAAALGNFTEVPMDDHEQVIRTDLLGTMYGSYLAMKHFISRGTGTLINVASMIARVPAPYYASYSAAKHGVLGFGGALRQELAVNKLDKDIHVCTVLPMAMDTPFFDHAANYTGHESKPIPPVNNAEEVVDTFVDLIFNPKAEVAVGKAGGIFSVSDALAPGLTESMMAQNTHKAQIEDAPPAPPTRGNLINPNGGGFGVHSDNISRP